MSQGKDGDAFVLSNPTITEDPGGPTVKEKSVHHTDPKDDSGQTDLFEGKKDSSVASESEPFEESPAHQGDSEDAIPKKKTLGIHPKQLKTIVSLSFGLSAAEFFSLLKKHGVTLLVDIRVGRGYQMARFSHEKDLPYLCEVHGVEYLHGTVFAPTRKLRDQFVADQKSKDQARKYYAWTEYLKGFQMLMAERKPSQNPDIKKNVIEGPHEVVAVACSCHHHCDCHRSYVAGLLVQQLDGVQLMVAYPEDNEPKRKSPRRYLLTDLPHAGLTKVEDPRRAADQGGAK